MEIKDRQPRYNIIMPEFKGKSIPVRMAAEIMGKDPQYIRVGLQQGWLPFGIAFKNKGSSEYNYYISPKKFYEFTGYVYLDG